MHRDVIHEEQEPKEVEEKLHKTVLSFLLTLCNGQGAKFGNELYMGVLLGVHSLILQL